MGNKELKSENNIFCKFILINTQGIYAQHKQIYHCSPRTRATRDQSHYRRIRHLFFVLGTPHHHGNHRLTRNAYRAGQGALHHRMRILTQLEQCIESVHLLFAAQGLSEGLA